VGKSHIIITIRESAKSEKSLIGDFQSVGVTSLKSAKSGNPDVVNIQIVIKGKKKGDYNPLKFRCYICLIFRYGELSPYFIGLIENSIRGRSLSKYFSATILMHLLSLVMAFTFCRQSRIILRLLSRSERSEG